MKAKTEEFSVDSLMLNTASTLVRDFQRNLDDPLFLQPVLELYRSGDVAGIRGHDLAPPTGSSIAYFKAMYQVESLVKRYRFSNDLYTDAELTTRAIDGFRGTQARLRELDLSCVSLPANIILDRAAKYIARVLGPYCDAEHRRLCKFGKKASVGVPARLACEAARWELPITGSREQISWFDAEMREDDAVQEYWIDQLERDPTRSVYQETSHLTLALVPKTFKSLRSIMPNTTIGSYMSYGLGEIIRKRLKRIGYDIRTLQQQHRELAAVASRTGELTTTDLSSASDCITVALVHRLFPSDWVKILEESRIPAVMLPDGSIEQSVTFCTMGIGYTFPLQTLVFLSLLKATEATLKHRTGKCTISVYGDDMIYTSSLHQFVVPLFEEVGFVINIDKTFHEGDFRESCGGDYYRGVDVRPFQPRNGSAMVGIRAYEATLYKFINGLLRRWSECEIEMTLAYLCRQLESIPVRVKLVPGDFPDDAGVRCPTLTSWNFLKSVHCMQPKFVGHGLYRFSYLRLTPQLREEVRHGPYYWVALRRPDPTFDYSNDQDGLRRGCSSHLSDVIEFQTGVSCSHVSLLLPLEVKPVQMVRSTLTGRRLRRIATYVTESHSGRYTRQSGTSGFEDRR